MNDEEGANAKGELSMPTPIELRNEYLARVADLYAKVKQWMGNIDPSAQLTEENITIQEDPVGKYSAQSMWIDCPSRKRIQLIPRGRWILGAEGRVDIKSDLGMETLVYVEGELFISIREISDRGTHIGRASSQPLFEDIAQGWVYLQNSSVGLMPSLDEDLFHRLWEVLSR